MATTSSPDASVCVSSPPIENVPVTVDSRGRVRTSREQRRLILAEFERSGVSGAQFARRTGLKYSTLAGWVQRYRRTKAPGRQRAVRLLEAVMEQPGGSPSVLATLQFAGGARMEIATVQQAVLAAELLRALAKI